MPFRAVTESAGSSNKVKEIHSFLHAKAVKC